MVEFFFNLINKEIIHLTCLITKFNRKNKKQERNFMITNKGIYNLSKTSFLFP